MRKRSCAPYVKALSLSAVRGENFPSRPEKLNLKLWIWSVAATVAAVCLFCPHPFFLTLILGAVIFFLIRISDSTQIDFMVILQAGFIGAVAEFLAVITGAWKYERPNFFVIPTWLPLLWGIAAHIITHIAARASRINQKKQ